MKDKVQTMYLLPNLLADVETGKESERDPTQVLPGYNAKVVQSIKHFIVENEKNARRFLRDSGVMPPYDTISLYKIDSESKINQVTNILKEINGADFGVISDAGCPGIADPGQWVARVAHEQGIKVIPLVGPSSILLALMASGFNGQSFTFHGYLPAKPFEREEMLKKLEKETSTSHATQIFIETPYRNMHLFNSMINCLAPTTKLSIAANLTAPEQWVKTRKISAWKNQTPNLDRIPCVFSLYVEK